MKTIIEPIYEIVRRWDIDQLQSAFNEDQDALLFDLHRESESVFHAVFDHLIADDGTVIGEDTLSDVEIARGIEVLNFIIDKFGNNVGEIINRPDLDGNTPLHYLAQSFDDKGIEFAKILIANGARADINNDIDLSPVEIAEENDHSKIREYLAMNIKGNIAPPSNIESPRANSLDHHKNNQLG